MEASYVKYSNQEDMGPERRLLPIGTDYHGSCAHLIDEDERFPHGGDIEDAPHLSTMQVAHPRPTPHTRHWDAVTPLVSLERPVPLCASHHHRHLQRIWIYLA